MGPADFGRLAGGIGSQRRGHYGRRQVRAARREQDSRESDIFFLIVATLHRCIYCTSTVSDPEELIMFARP